ncbi:MAG TPA: hypothetical protein VE570_06730 [Thermoleophilaceae bacterium]|nr:hypothetical protein [Thermoleophilaceae bacterium]
MGYESWYLKASHPSEPLGVWIRYTTHQRPGGPEKPSLWFALFADGTPKAAKVTLGPDALSHGNGAFIRIGEAEFAEGRVRGSALDAGWDLAVHDTEPELRHLPREWMYKAPIPRTKLTSPYPAALFTGRVAFGEQTVELDGWPGVVGHNWGAEHAERWIWLQGAGFEGEGVDTWLDVAIGRVKIGPWTTPWIANGALSLQGERHQIGGIAKARATVIDEHPDRCAFTLPGADVTLRGEVSAPRERFVGWRYADPDGSEHNTVNCSIAQLTLDVEGAGSTVKLATAYGAAYELGMRETDHGIPIQPFPDG